MKRSLILMSCLFALITSIYAAKKTKVIKITVSQLLDIVIEEVMMQN